MAMAAVGCEHTAPFSFDYPEPTTPFQPGNPARLTFNPGLDTRASWLPDGSAFLYTQAQGRPDHDQCLVAMPGSGGATIRTICTDTDRAGDSSNVFLAPAVAVDGRMAYLRSSTLANFGRTTPDYSFLVVATYADPQPAAVIERLPHLSPGGQTVDVATDLHWTAPSTLIFLADRFQIICLNLSCTAADTSIVGLEIDQAVVSAAPPAITLVAGTVGASAVATAGADTLYYTLSSDPGGLHRRIFSTSADSVVFTFPGAVTGLSAAGGRVAAAVGGTLHLLTLATGVDTVLPAAGPTGVVDHPALDPTGRVLVADVTDTATTLPADLWLWTIP